MAETITTNSADNDNPLPNVTDKIFVTDKILAKLIEYCKKHVETATPETADTTTTTRTSTGGVAGGDDDDELKKWDEEYVTLVLGANYITINDLLDLPCQIVADMIKGKTPEKIRTTFNIVNDFTPEEEEDILRESQWDFE